ncbi:8-oxoguanine glycosylase ogg1 [Steccherinum ochraceum]|uniref:DNA-(apurinic or apyrimidinic site) lyase n=1 Tax=Steccherinum ochraceum TaxID=92696 RepID=A0A4V2MWF6_9APHY|nr:8-oxoguanine glycosylase ogg1 [Steccherinum ochraceum]
MIISIPVGFRALPLPVAQLSLAAVLQCGQSFRWSVFPLPYPDFSVNPDAPRHEYRVCLRDRVVCLRQTPDTLFYRAVYPSPSLDPKEEANKDAETLSWIRDYFQLDVDLLDLYSQWSKLDPVFHKLKDRFEGIRVLRQDPFECLLSFICSSNNNITRITKMVRALCTQFSSPVISLPPPNAEPGTELEPYHPFPPPSALSAPEVTATLRTLGFGYRAEFIQKTAKMLADNHNTSATSSAKMQEPAELWLTTLRQMSTSEARNELLKFMGVGRKVADCVMLMSLDKREVVPVDTHVHQIATKHYGMSSSSKSKAVKTTMTPKLYDELSSKFVGIWGEYAGWAHCVLFTSDLKAFASYGLETSSPSPSAPPSMSTTPTISAASTPSASPAKRKRAASKINVVKTEVVATVAEVSEDGSLAERVKRRRQLRVVATDPSK